MITCFTFPAVELELSAIVHTLVAVLASKMQVCCAVSSLQRCSVAAGLSYLGSPLQLLQALTSLSQQSSCHNVIDSRTARPQPGPRWRQPACVCVWFFFIKHSVKPTGTHINPFSTTGSDFVLCRTLTTVKVSSYKLDEKRCIKKIKLKSHVIGFKTQMYISGQLRYLVSFTNAFINHSFNKI